MKTDFSNEETKVLTETWRRLNYFHGNDLNTNLLMLSMPARVKTLIEKGILKAASKETPRVLNWYNLTDTGKQMFSKYLRRKISDAYNSSLFNGEKTMKFEL